MFKKSFIVCALFFSLFCTAQNPNATYFFNEGLKAFNNKDFALADSLYTLSLRHQRQADTYFNRALTRQKMNKPKAYSEDLAYAAGMGDKASYALLQKDFQKIDTLPITVKLVQVDSTEHKFYHVTYSTSKTKEVLEAKFNADYKILNVIWYAPRLQIDTVAEESAEFVGGLPGLMNYIRTSVQYPAEAREKGVTGKAFLKFSISAVVTIERVEVLKGVEGCKECDQEAMRVVASMPRWKAARLNGRPVRIYFTLPFSFKIQ